MSSAQVARVRRYKGDSPAQRWASLAISLLLHGSLIAAFLIASLGSRTPYKLDTPMINLTQLTIGASGPKPKVQPDKGTEAAPPAKAKVEEKSLPPKVEEKSVPVPKVEEKPVPAPPVEEKLVPVPKIDELKKTPEEAPKAEADKKAEPEKKAEPAPEPKPAAKPEPAPPTDEELLAAALAGARTDAKPAPKISGGQSLLDDALKSAGTDAKTEKIITGEGGTGVGVLALYEDVVIWQIRQNFVTHPYADGRIKEVKVLVEIANNGALASATVLTPSGDPSLDAKVLRAIRMVDKFETPPGGRAQKLELIFSSDMYAGQ